MSYSQNDEERYILEACKDVGGKRLLDIGAFHPTQYSNSRALLESGWFGVLIEPSPVPLRNLVGEYGHDQKVLVVSAAVVPQCGGWVDIEISDDGVSSTQVDQVAKWEKSGGYIGKLRVATLTIWDICDQYGAFDCVSIDTEGTSVDILKALLATEMYPRCICCEYDDRLAEAQIAAQARGYRTVYTSRENVVLVLE